MEFEQGIWEAENNGGSNRNPIVPAQRTRTDRDYAAQYSPARIRVASDRQDWFCLQLHHGSVARIPLALSQLHVGSNLDIFRLAFDSNSRRTRHSCTIRWIDGDDVAPKPVDCATSGLAMALVRHIGSLVWVNRRHQPANQRCSEALSLLLVTGDIDVTIAANRRQDCRKNARFRTTATR